MKRTRHDARDTLSKFMVPVVTLPSDAAVSSINVDWAVAADFSAETQSQKAESQNPQSPKPQSPKPESSREPKPKPRCIYCCEPETLTEYGTCNACYDDNEVNTHSAREYGLDKALRAEWRLMLKAIDEFPVRDAIRGWVDRVNEFHKWQRRSTGLYYKIVGGDDGRTVLVRTAHPANMDPNGTRTRYKWIGPMTRRHKCSMLLAKWKRSQAALAMAAAMMKVHQ